MAEPTSRSPSVQTSGTEDEVGEDLLSYDPEIEEELEVFADALAGLPD